MKKRRHLKKYIGILLLLSLILLSGGETRADSFLLLHLKVFGRRRDRYPMPKTRRSR